jgi:restriction system protein
VGQHEREVAEWQAREAERERKLDKAARAHEAEVARVRQEIQEQHSEFDRFKAGLEQGDPEAVVDYFGLVLERSGYPEGFPKAHKLAYVPESRQLVLEYDLPSFEIVPEVKAYKYVKSRDEVTTAAQTATKRKSLYADVVAKTSLRCVHELFEADRNNIIETIVFNGIVDSIDKRTGRPTRTCIVTLRTTKDMFEELDLGLVDAQECLKGLNAGVSKKPSELAPVRPVLEFSMVDARFTDESDVLSTLDQRPNLMELSPGEFESLITNLFEKMGLETRQTRPSRDGGVDCVAWDTRPILGGKVVIQAKRYKNTVGVAAVRDLFGTVHNEGAVKGILVTTSGYGKSSFEFADGKPLELLDGSNLLYLLREHAEMEAKIEPPEDWVDPEGAVVA